MGRVLGYYCPMCGSEFSELYDKNECANCKSVLFAKFDFFPFKKNISQLLKKSTGHDPIFESILPVDQLKRVASTVESRELMVDGSVVNLIIHDAAKNLSGVASLSGLQVQLEYLRNTKILPMFFYDESIYAALFLRSLLKLKFKIVVPEVIGEKNLNQLLTITDDLDVVEGVENINKFLKASGNNLLDYHNSVMVIEGQKILFYNILRELKSMAPVHFVIPAGRLDLIYGLFKVKTELDKLGEKIQRRFRLHVLLERAALNPVQKVKVSARLKDIKTIVKSLNGSMTELAENDIVYEKRKIKQKTGILAGGELLTCLAGVRLLYEEGKIKENDMAVIINYTDISHEFKH